MSDTPVLPQSYPPPSRLDQIKAFVGDLARPFAIIASNGAASIAIVKIAWTIAEKSSSWEGAAVFVGAAGAYAGAMFGAKAWEVARTGKQATELEIAKVAAEPPQPTRTP